MDASCQAKPARQGFTLVELLVVIVIIAMLAGLITNAAFRARIRAKEAVVRSEVSQLEMALQDYKNEIGEYPPDFTCLNVDDDPTDDKPAELAAEAVLTRHLRRRFPRFRGDWDDAVDAIKTNYETEYRNRTGTDIEIDLSWLDQASALGFWLGGLPEAADSDIPAGFHSDPSNPFKPGRPRTKRYFEFPGTEDGSARRMVVWELGQGSTIPVTLRCYYYAASVPQAPLVYFRPQRTPTGKHTYAFMERDPTDTTQYITAVRSWEGGGAVGRAVPYLGGRSSLGGGVTWLNQSTFQIVCSGLDEAFGDREVPLPPAPGTSPPAYDYPVAAGTGKHFTPGDRDNLTNFADGRLEDALE